MQPLCPLCARAAWMRAVTWQITDLAVDVAPKKQRIDLSVRWFEKRIALDSDYPDPYYPNPYFSNPYLPNPCLPNLYCSNPYYPNPYYPDPYRPDAYFTDPYYPDRYYQPAQDYRRLGRTGDAERTLTSFRAASV